MDSFKEQVILYKAVCSELWTKIYNKFEKQFD